MTLVPIAAICVRASEPDLAHHAQVLERLVEEARSFEFPEDIEITVRQISPAPNPSESELARLRRLAPVDANARLRLEQMAAEIESGGVERKMFLMYANEDHWRLNRDRTPGMVVKYLDSATNGRTKWQLTDRTLQFAAASDVIDEFAIESGPGMVRLWLATFITGAAWPLEADYELVEVAPIDTGSTLYMLRFDESVVRRLTVEHGESEPGPRVVLVETSLTNDFDNFVPIARISDWRWSEVMGRDIAHRYEMITRAGQIELAIVLDSIKPLDRNLRELTIVPSADGSDFFRGTATFASATDLSRGRIRPVDIDSRTVLEAVDVKKKVDPWMRWGSIFAVAAAGVTVAMLVWLKSSRIKES